MTDKSQQEALSAYDKEWGLSDDDSDNSNVGAEDDQLTPDGSTDPDGASADEGGVAKAKTDPNSEEIEGADDVWANATPQQLEAFRRAENKRLAAENRAKQNADRLAERGREQKQLRDKLAELEEAQRVPTEFEREFDQYAKDVEAIADRVVSKRLHSVGQAEPETPEQIEAKFFETLTEAHPDAGDVYNSAELQALLADDPVFKLDGRAVLFSEALHSDDAATVVKALTHFKSTLPTLKTDNGLDGMRSPNGGASKTDMRRVSQLSTKEQYDREWESDDI